MSIESFYFNFQFMKHAKKKIQFSIIFFLLSFLQFTLSSENLIKNPGFEEQINKTPAYWFLFVKPQEGSFGEIDNTTFHSGENSALLNNTINYSREPMNNWSQRIFLKSNNNQNLCLEGWIKSQDVSRSYILLQFWKQTPAQLLESKTTEIISGTNEWEKVSLEIPITKGTDFIMLRCVIEGVGSVWFDDISLYYCDEKEKLNEEDEIDKESTEIEEKIEKIQEEMEILRQENIQLQEKINFLEESNKQLKDELQRLIVEEKTDDTNNGEAQIDINEQINEDNYVSDTNNENNENIQPPPLVPHKKNWKKILKEKE